MTQTFLDLPSYSLPFPTGKRNGGREAVGEADLRSQRVQSVWATGQNAPGPHLGTTGTPLGWFLTDTTLPFSSCLPTPALVLWAKWGRERTLRTPAQQAAVWKISPPAPGAGLLRAWSSGHSTPISSQSPHARVCPHFLLHLIRHAVHNSEIPQGLSPAG